MVYTSLRCFHSSSGGDDTNDISLCRYISDDIKRTNEQATAALYQTMYEIYTTTVEKMWGQRYNRSIPSFLSYVHFPFLFSAPSFPLSYQSCSCPLMNQMKARHILTCTCSISFPSTLFSFATHHQIPILPLLPDAP
jgi:hypothetical protein